MAGARSSPRLNGESCAFCGGRRLKHFAGGNSECHSKDAVKVVECRQCQVAWQWPLGRTTADSEEHYERRYSETGSKDCRYFDPRERTDVARAQLQFVLGHVLRHVEEFAALRTAARTWSDWVGLPIFTLAGQASHDGTSRRSIPN